MVVYIRRLEILYTTLFTGLDLPFTFLVFTLPGRAQDFNILKLRELDLLLSDSVALIINQMDLELTITY